MSPEVMGPQLGIYTQILHRRPPLRLGKGLPLTQALNEDAWHSGPKLPNEHRACYAPWTVDSPGNRGPEGERMNQSPPTAGGSPECVCSLLSEEMWVLHSGKRGPRPHPEGLPHGPLYQGRRHEGRLWKATAHRSPRRCCLPKAGLGLGLEQGQAGRGNILSSKWEEGRRNRRGGKSQTRKLLHHLLPTKTESPAD